MPRNCVVIANIANLTGTLNHGIKNLDGSYEKIRIDYSKLLTYLLNDRVCLGAYAISQQEISIQQNNPVQVKANQIFAQNLNKVGWTPIKVEYDGATKDLNPILDAIWQHGISTLVSTTGEWAVDPEITDIVFVNGSSSWFEAIESFSNTGFQIEIAYPKLATSNLLSNNFAFLDLTEFFLSQHKQKIPRGDLNG